MELIIEEKPLDASVAYRCDLCNYNPYQAWCKGNVARFHAALMKHKQTARHREAEAFAKGEQPVSIDKNGRLSGDAPPERPPHFYITKLETMIDKLEQRIDALNNAYEPSETSSEDNLNKFGSLVGDFRQNEQTSKSEKSGELVNAEVLNVATHTFQFKEMELKAMRKFGDGSCITNTNALNALIRCKNWCEVFIKDEVRRKKNISYIGRTIDMVKSLCSLIAEGWRAEDEDYDAIGERMDEIMEHEFYT
jgi:hypothetical protein